MVRVIAPAEARALDLPGRSSREIVSGGQGAQDLSFRLVEITPGKPDTPERGPHIHGGFEECIYVLSGSGVMESEGGKHPFKAGDTVLVPAGELHVTHATGTAPLRLLCFFPTANVAAGTTEFPSWEAARKGR